MSKVAIQITILDEPEGWMWQRIREIIEEGQAASLGARTYEFHTYGDACCLTAELDHHNLRYQKSIVGDD